MCSSPAGWHGVLCTGFSLQWEGLRASPGRGERAALILLGVSLDCGDGVCLCRGCLAWSDGGGDTGVACLSAVRQ